MPLEQPFGNLDFGLLCWFFDAGGCGLSRGGGGGGGGAVPGY